jgi:hypothetical protein
LRYRAFISYSSADRAAAGPFLRALDSFRMPPVLRGKEFGRGPAPVQIAPLFRDCAETRADDNVPDDVRAALEDAPAIIVLCSPAAARSARVNALLRLVKKQGRIDQIYPVLLSGIAQRYEIRRARRTALFPRPCSSATTPRAYW